MSKRPIVQCNKDGRDCASPLPASSFENPVTKAVIIYLFLR